MLGTQRVNRAALPHMRGQGLLVWVVGSSSNRGGTPPFLGPYFAAKAAMDAPFGGVPFRMPLAYRRRVGAEELHGLRRHPDPIRLTLLVAFCHVRGLESADTLTELLITTVYRVEGELIADLKRVAGKPALLFKLAAASLAQPDGAVRDVVFPAVGEQTLRNLVAEGENTGPIYWLHLQTVVHNSYRSHHRRMLPLVLDALSFQVRQPGAPARARRPNGANLTLGPRPVR